MTQSFVPTEEAECLVLAQYLRLSSIQFAHIPNNTWTQSIKQKVKNKNMGVSPGVPDYMIVLPRCLLFIEMKRKKGGTVSEAQKEWIHNLNSISPTVIAVVCHGADEAIQTVEKYLN